MIILHSKYLIISPGSSDSPTPSSVLKHNFQRSKSDSYLYMNISSEPRYINVNKFSDDTHQDASKHPRK